jgi:hypothetical protein
VTERFRDPGSVWMSFLGEEILVRCPGCQGLAMVVFHPEHDADGPVSRHAFAPHRLVCPACGVTREWSGRQITRHDDARDPYFGLPLWLQASCAGGNLLWAYGLRHLDLLEDYISARLRERGFPPGSMSMVERLPAWLKSGRNRDEVLRTIHHLRASVPPSRGP